MSFNDPWVLLFIPCIFIAGFFIKNNQKLAGLRFSSISLFSGLGSSLRGKARMNLIYVRSIALSLMLIALARPQSPIEDTIKRSEGIDIILTIDLSTSMLAEDFSIGKKKRNRLYAVKEVIPDFIKRRKNDRIAMVVFATRPFIASPLTLNHDWLLKRFEKLKAGMLGNRTAIGSAIASSLNRLRKSKAKSKVIILLTDGRNNAGEVTPETTADIAKALDVKIYTIGAGTFGSVPFPVLDTLGNVIRYDSVKMDMDESLLRKIAQKTGGRYFRVTDTTSLRRVYKEIDRMERFDIEDKAYDEYNELFWRFLLAGLIILLLEVILSNTMLKRIP